MKTHVSVSEDRRRTAWSHADIQVSVEGEAGLKSASGQRNGHGERVLGALFRGAVQTGPATSCLVRGTSPSLLSSMQTLTGD